MNLVCSGGETRRRLLGLFMMLGLMVGSLIGGKLVDKYGRKWVMLASITVIIPTQVLDKNNNQVRYSFTWPKTQTFSL